MQGAAPRKERTDRKVDVGMQTYRIEVGSTHGVKPANIVGAIANEAGLEAKYIGRIDIFDDHSVLDLPVGMPKELFDQLKTVWVAGQQLRISQVGEAAPGDAERVADRKNILSVPKRGGDRRVSEKAAGDKAPFKAKSGFGKRPADKDKGVHKPRSKGPKTS